MRLIVRTIALSLLIGGPSACQARAAMPQCPPAVPVITNAPPANPPVPYDLPRTEDFVGMQMVYAVDVQPSGIISVDGRHVGSDEALRESARHALQTEPNVRAVIRADSLTPWMHIVHVMDVLKQSGMTKIAFGVQAKATKAQPPSLDPSTVWDCPFPEAADKANIDQAEAQIIVHVDRDGKAEHVEMVNDPGYGFGEAASRCARNARYRPARDENDLPVPGKTPPIRVRFTR